MLVFKWTFHVQLPARGQKITQYIYSSTYNYHWSSKCFHSVRMQIFQELQHHKHNVLTTQGLAPYSKVPPKKNFCPDFLSNVLMHQKTTYSKYFFFLIQQKKKNHSCLIRIGLPLSHCKNFQLIKTTPQWPQWKHDRGLNQEATENSTA